MKKDYIKVPARSRIRVATDNFLKGLSCKLDETVMPDTYAAELYNFDTSTGALIKGYGIESADDYPAGTVSAWVYRFFDVQNGWQERRMCLAGNAVFEEDTAGFREIAGLSLSSSPLAINYRLYGEDVILLCPSDGNMVVYNGDTHYSVESSPHITSAAVHYERLFASSAGESVSVNFSDDLDPTNWSTDLTAGGFIQLVDDGGRVLKVVSFLGYVYIFRERGISRLIAYADQSDFSVSSLFTLGGRIYADTVQLCGDRILFMADDGLYAFDGLSAQPVLTHLSPMFEAGGKPVALYREGKYILAARGKAGAQPIACENGAYTNNILLVYEPASGSVGLSRGMDVERLSDDGRGALATLRGGACGYVQRCGKLLGENLPMRWRTPQKDLGSGARHKLVKTLVIDSEFPCTVRVVTDEGERVVQVPGGGLHRAAVNLTGKKVHFCIDAVGEARISRPELIISLGRYE